MEQVLERTLSLIVTKPFQMAWFKKAKDAVIPTDKALAEKYAKEVVAYIMNIYDIEEQSQIAVDIKQILIQKREEELTEALEKVETLKENLNKLKIPR